MIERLAPVRFTWRGIVSMFFIALFAACVGAGIGAISLEAFDRRPPTVIKQLFDANSITYRDGRIQLFYRVQNFKQCQTYSTRWLWTWVNYNGAQVEIRMPLSGSSSSAKEKGDHSYLLSLPLPEGVWDGDWYLRSYTIYYCGIFGWAFPYYIDSGNIPVKIQGTEMDHMRPNVSPGKRPRSHIVIHGGGNPVAETPEVRSGNPLP